MKLITLTTDFKDQFAAAQKKAVALALDFTGRLIENHDVKSFSITLELAVNLGSAADKFRLKLGQVINEL